MAVLSDHHELHAIPEIYDIGLDDIRAALLAGWADFCSAPLFGIFFSATYVVGGWAMYLIYAKAGLTWWVIPLIVGFPMIAPLAAVGLYEVSHQMEQTALPRWGRVLRVVIGEHNRQMLWVGVLILFWFILWVLVANAIFTIIMGHSVLLVVPNLFYLLDLFATKQGMTLLAFEVGLGMFYAFVIFVATAISLPMLLDREIDVVMAMMISAKAVLKNFRVMLVWAFIIAIILFFGMLMGLLGLFVAIPVLGHATWHLYRRIVPE